MIESISAHRERSPAACGWSSIGVERRPQEWCITIISRPPGLAGRGGIACRAERVQKSIPLRWRQFVLPQRRDIRDNLSPARDGAGNGSHARQQTSPPRQIVRYAPTPPMVGHEEGSFGYSRSNLRPSHITSIGAAVCAAPQPTHVTSIHGFRMRSLASVPMKDASDGQCGHGALANECRGDFRPSARWVRP